MGIATDVPQELIEAVIAELAPRRIILFGSRARGDGDDDSDWDLLLVLDDDTEPERAGWQSLHAARRGFAGPVDLVPCRETDFRERADVVGSLPWLAIREGRLVYERPDAG